jgi:trimethylamine---corrinoid protein Co-methyltransferase
VNQEPPPYLNFVLHAAAFYDFELADNNSFEQWSAEGGLDRLQRANRRWKRLLEAYEPPPLDAAREEALLDFGARRKRSMPDELG